MYSSQRTYEPMGIGNTFLGENMFQLEISDNTYIRIDGNGLIKLDKLPLVDRYCLPVYLCCSLILIGCFYFV